MKKISEDMRIALLKQELETANNNTEYYKKRLENMKSNVVCLAQRIRDPWAVAALVLIIEMDKRQ